MPLFDPTRYTHNYSGQSRRRSASHPSHPIPGHINFSDQRILDQEAKTPKIFNVKRRALPGPVMNTEEVGLKWEEKKFVIRERKKEMKKIQLKEKRGGERELWCSNDWRNKDLDQLSNIRN